MKNFYTAKELGNLTPEELEQITSFRGEDTNYYYSEISKISEEGDEFCIVFNDGEEIYTKNIELIGKIKNGKARYDLIAKTLERQNIEQDEHRAFYEQVQSDIAEQMQEMHQQVNIQKQNFELMVESIQKKTNNDIAKLGNTVASTLESWNKRIDSLNSVDTKKFDKMMSQMEKITSAFSTLLED